MSRKKYSMKISLVHQDIDEPWEAKNISIGDVKPLGELLMESFRDTVDDEGETPEEAAEEVRVTLQGKYGAFIPEASFFIEEEGKPVSAIIVTLIRENSPLMAFVMTHPRYQKRGMGKYLIQKSINSLVELGYKEYFLGVTKKNYPAVKLYKKMGFEIFRK